VSDLFIQWMSTGECFFLNSCNVPSWVQVYCGFCWWWLTSVLWCAGVTKWLHSLLDS